MVISHRGDFLEWSVGGLICTEISIVNLIERDGVADAIGIGFVKRKKIVGSIPDSIIAKIVSDIIPIRSATIPKPVNARGDLDGVETLGSSDE